MFNVNESENHITTKEEANHENPSQKQYLISNEKFALLKHYQQLILQETDAFPSIRKLINDLIKTDALEKAKENFIALIRQ